MIGEQQDLDSRLWVVRLDLIVWGVFSWCEKKKISDFLLIYGCMIWVDSFYKNTSAWFLVLSFLKKKVLEWCSSSLRVETRV